FNKKISWFGVKDKDRHSLSEGKDVQDLISIWDRFDFVKHSNKFFAFSSLMIIVGIVILFIFKLNLGIDFTSGTREVIVNESIATEDEVSRELEKLDMTPEALTESGDDTYVACYSTELSQEQVTEMQNHFNDVYGHEPMISTVSPTI